MSWGSVKVTGSQRLLWGIIIKLKGETDYGHSRSSEAIRGHSRNSTILDYICLRTMGDQVWFQEVRVQCGQPAKLKATIPLMRHTHSSLRGGGASGWPHAKSLFTCMQSRDWNHKRNGDFQFSMLYLHVCNTWTHLHKRLPTLVGN